MVCRHSNHNSKKGYDEKSKGQILLFKSKQQHQQQCYYIKSLLVYFFFMFIMKTCTAYPVGYSYSKFSGPVSGPEHEVVTQDEDDQYPRVDYIAKPDYHFAYGVEDPKSNVLHNREESRDGDAVKGEYSLIDPDGTHRIVRYTADKVNGFQAEVITDGKSSLYGHHDNDDDDDDDDTSSSHQPAPIQHYEYHHRQSKPARRYHHRNHGHPRHYTQSTQPPIIHQYHTIRKNIPSSEDDDDRSSADDDDDDDDDVY